VIAVSSRRSIRSIGPSGAELEREKRDGAAARPRLWSGPKEADIASPARPPHRRAGEDGL